MYVYTTFFNNSIMLGLHQHRLHFSIIDETDPNNLVWLDKSDYMEIPDLPILEVTKPMFNEVYRIHIIPNQVNVINSIQLGYDCDTALPDGVYILKYGLNPHDVIYKCVDYFKLSLLLEKIGKLLVSLDTSDLETVGELKNKIVDLYILTKGIVENTKHGRVQMAVEQYKLADKIVERLMACNKNNQSCSNSHKH